MKTRKKSVSVRLLRTLLMYAASACIDESLLLQTAGIEPDDIKDNGGTIDIERFISVAAALADGSVGAFSGLRLADGLGRIYGGNHILMTIMCCCPTLGDALQKLTRYHDIASDALRLELMSNSQDNALVLIPVTVFPPSLANVFLEAAVAACAVMVKSLTANTDCLARVCLTSPEPAETDAYERYFGCPVVFGCERNEIVFRCGALNAALALSDQALLDILEGYARSKLTGEAVGSMPERLKKYMDNMISQGKKFQIDDAAEELGVSVRTLQKRLKNARATYRALLEEAKKDIAVKSLEDPGVSILDTAFLLGFSEQSAFNRAFKKWTGVSPMKYRQRR